MKRIDLIRHLEHTAATWIEKAAIIQFISIPRHGKPPQFRDIVKSEKRW